MHTARLERWCSDLIEATVPEILRWTWDTFGPQVAATSSFQTQSVPLLHMISLEVPEMPVFFLNTGFHFPETLAFRDRLVREFGLDVHDLEAQGGTRRFQREYGDLYRTDPDGCCRINKVEPMRRALSGLTAWVSGIRGDQTAERSASRLLEMAGNTLKVCPMLSWTERDVSRYIREQKLPSHPLSDRGYVSIGCAPCTRPVSGYTGRRVGRWAGTGKTECGLHTELRGPTPGAARSSGRERT